MASIKIFWINVPNAESYTIYFNTSPGVTSSNGTPIHNIRDIFYLHENLIDGITYYYIVAAVDKNGIQSVPSVEVSALSSVVLESISITPADFSLSLTSTQPYTAIGHYADSSTQDITNLASWNILDTTIATVLNTNLNVPNVVTNSNFDSGNLSGWTTSSTGGVTVPTISTVQAHSGTHSCLVGMTTEPFNGNSVITQNIVVPNIAGTLLSFWYWPFTVDGISFDQQTVEIRDNTGVTTLATVMNVCENDQVWKNKIFDLTPYIGQTIQLYFRVHEDGSNDPTYMYIDDITTTAHPKGLVTASTFIGGTTTISATLSAITGSTSLTVTPAITSITVSAGTTGDGTQQFNATAHYSDSSTRDITSVAVWTSGTPSVATITNPGGLVTTVSTGSTLITATYGGHSGNATFNNNVHISFVSPIPTYAINNSFTTINTTVDFGGIRWYVDGYLNGDNSVGIIIPGPFPSTSPDYDAFLSVTPTNVTIRARSDINPAIFAEITLAVVSLNSILVLPSNGQAGWNASGQFYAWGTYDNDIIRHITDTVQWSSNNLSLASIQTFGFPHTDYFTETFENGLTGWTTSGHVTLDTTFALSSTFDGYLNAQSATANPGNPTPDSVLSRLFTVPNNGGTTVLSYTRLVISSMAGVSGAGNSYEILIKDSTGTTTLHTVEGQTFNFPTSNGFFTLESDLSSFAGQTIMLYFHVHAADGTTTLAATSMYIDNILITNHQFALASTQGGYQTTFGGTGVVTITAQSGSIIGTASLQVGNNF